MNRLRITLLFSAFAMLVACGSSDKTQNEAERGVTVELPPFEPEPIADADPAVNEAASLNVMVRPEQEIEPPPGVEPPKTEPKPQPPDRADTQKATAPRPTASARLPLSNARIAETIQRIGYSCGEVTGAEPVAGADVPTWKISCSSGESYRGTSRGGHMRFRKLGN